MKTALIKWLRTTRVPILRGIAVASNFLERTTPARTDRMAEHLPRWLLPSFHCFVSKCHHPSRDLQQFDRIKQADRNFKVVAKLCHPALLPLLDVRHAFTSTSRTCVRRRTSYSVWPCLTNEWEFFVLLFCFSYLNQTVISMTFYSVVCLDERPTTKASKQKTLSRKTSSLFVFSFQTQLK